MFSNASESEVEGLQLHDDPPANLARRDGLTGFLNRRAFDEALPLALERAAGESKSVALILIDVDHFKAVNDAHGRPAGDAVLCQLARVLNDASRKRDEVFRFGAEKFAVIVYDVPAGAALCLADALRGAVADAPVAFDGREVLVTVSAGVAWAGWPDAPTDASTLVAQAGERLREAKRRGRNRCVLQCTPEPTPRETSWVSRLSKVFASSAR